MGSCSIYLQHEGPNDRLIVTLTLKELEELVVKAVKIALINAPPPKGQYTLDEAAALLNVTPTWLAEKCRKGEVPHHRLAHHYRFTSGIESSSNH